MAFFFPPFAGFGKQADPVGNITNVINTSISKTLLKSLSICENDISGNQIISMKCDATPEMAAIYANSENCRIRGGSACYACVQEDLKQSSVLSFSASCNDKSVDVLSLQNDIKSNLEQDIKKTTGMFDFLGSGGADPVNIGNVTTTISQSVTKDVVNKVLSKLVSSQAITMTSTGGSIQKGLTQDAALTMTIQSLKESQLYSTTVNSMVSDIIQKWTKKPADPFASIISSLVSSAFCVCAGAGLLYYQGQKLMGPLGVAIVGIILIVIGGIVVNKAITQKDGKDNKGGEGNKAPGIILIAIGILLLIVAAIWGYMASRSGTRGYSVLGESAFPDMPSYTAQPSSGAYAYGTLGGGKKNFFKKSSIKKNFLQKSSIKK